MTIEEKAIRRLLDSRMEDYEGTVREWIKEVTVALVVEGEGFSGKRPLGNSCWDYDLACAMCRAGLIEHHTEVDDYGELDYEFAWGHVNDAWANVVDYLLR